MDLYFSDYFEVDKTVLEEYGAFDISLATDLPLFIDPFLLFNSDKAEYQELHEDIIKYLKFLRDEASPDLSDGLIKSWYTFKEVKQNWLGFTEFGNNGSGLGMVFARALHSSLSSILSNFGEETVTRGSHLEKLALIKDRVGRDNISDFTTNLVKHYLLSYTEKFARDFIDPKYCRVTRVSKALFNYQTKTWMVRSYYLPIVKNDFVLLTPADILTRDNTWINHDDMLGHIEQLPSAVEDEQLRSQIEQYFASRLTENSTHDDRKRAAQATINRYHELIDIYIKLKEDAGDQAATTSQAKTEDTRRTLVNQVRKAILDLNQRTNFYDLSWTSYDEARLRVLQFKHYVENQDGYRLINRGDGQPLSNEKEVQLFFGLIWMNNDFDVNREPNNGRGPVDFKVSFGSKDASLIEFKLAKSTSLKRNLARQVGIYEKANQTKQSVKVVICYSASEQARLSRILGELDLTGDESIISVDARSDNKASASKA
ncbi:hypothetical protein MN2019_24265 [Mycolicibacterium neoaurum]|uniref:hypothetical protein n=1 Tax=Mycolicibacterium neoaurum TaxID=1795 RepID=UPI001BCAA964|nr:hypothetical protein [Mycolicibacterium neoaurum]QVI27285.1 hypothetical protein MN2019_24265 [Mycolicibacterium neoaurum]